VTLFRFWSLDDPGGRRERAEQGRVDCGDRRGHGCQLLIVIATFLELALRSVLNLVEIGPAVCIYK